MGIGLFEYAQQNPGTQEPPQEAQAIRDEAQAYQQREARREAVTRLKESILQQLEQGNAPQLILYTALKAIGEATGDPDFTETATEYLDIVYGDLMQESFLIDNAAVAAKRLEDQRNKYLEKLKKQLSQQLRGMAKLERALHDAMDAAQAFDEPPAVSELDIPPNKYE